MRRSAPAFAAALALGLTGCDHGSNRQQATAPPTPSPYTPQAVQRAFARAGLPVAHDRQIETMARTSGDGSTAAFFTDVTGTVQVTVSHGGWTTHLSILVGGEQEQPATTSRGNVWVTYLKRSPQAPKVTRALGLLRQSRRAPAHSTGSRYSQGNDSLTGASYCVAYDRDGTGGSVLEGTCPKH
jgi:hypothetical protein